MYKSSRFRKARLGVSLTTPAGFLNFSLKSFPVISIIFLLMLPYGFSLQAQGFGANFTKSPKGRYGGVACQKQGGDYNHRWHQYFSYNDTSMTISAGNDCRQVYSGASNGCILNLGDTGITEISFDFSISNECHQSPASMDWFAFFLTSMPWAAGQEVDFIESKFGGTNYRTNNTNYGLNTNFGGKGQQLTIFDSSFDGKWEGTVKATFSGSGDQVKVVITNSANTGQATWTLQESENYTFVFNTTQTVIPGCSITISNISATGTLPNNRGSDNCVGIGLNNN